jgi:hypothetical protein
VSLRAFLRHGPHAELFGSRAKSRYAMLVRNGDRSHSRSPLRPSLRSAVVPPEGGTGSLGATMESEGEVTPVLLNVFADVATFEVVIHQAHGLHEGVGRRRTDELPSTLLEIFR